MADEHNREGGASAPPDSPPSHRLHAWIPPTHVVVPTPEYVSRKGAGHTVLSQVLQIRLSRQDKSFIEAACEILKLPQAEFHRSIAVEAAKTIINDYQEHQAKLDQQDAGDEAGR